MIWGAKKLGLQQHLMPMGHGDTGRYWGSQRARLGEYAYSIRGLAVPEDWWLMVVIYLMHQLQYVAVQRSKSMEGTTWNRYHKFHNCFMAGHF